MAKPLAIAIRHVAFEDLGSLEPALRNHGFDIRYLEAGVDNIADLIQQSPAVVVALGAPIGANQTQEYPFLVDELKLIEHRLHHKLPTIGICLGAQLMAHVLGGRVYKGAVPEIGWAPIKLTNEGKGSCLKHLEDPTIRVWHWHQDTFELPKQVASLCMTENYANQAFALGNYGLALQFHLEALGEHMERWFIGHACEIGACPGLSVQRLREDSREWARPLRNQATKVWDEWITAIKPMIKA